MSRSAARSGIVRATDGSVPLEAGVAVEVLLTSETKVSQSCLPGQVLSVAPHTFFGTERHTHYRGKGVSLLGKGGQPAGEGRVSLLGRGGFAVIRERITSRWRLSGTM